MKEVSALDALLGADVNVTEDVFMERLGVSFTVQSMTGNSVNKLREQCTYTEGTGSTRRTFINEEELGNLLITKGCISPDFSDPKLLEKYDATDAADCVQKALLAGEVATLSSAVMDVSGYDNGKKQVEKAKN